MRPGWGAGAARWLWRSRSLAAGQLRVLLLPLAALYRAAVFARNTAYDVGLLGTAPLPRPSIGVGNLSVGGTGKTPLAAWLAGALMRRGVTAGIVMRGYGDDEVREHRAANPDVAVEAGANRHAAAARAVSRGAEVLVLDDCLQRRDVTVDLMVAVVSADTWTSRRWPLPSGPWREGLAALARADVLVVTRKTASLDAADALRRSLAPRVRVGLGVTMSLELTALTKLDGTPGMDPAMLAGRDIMAVSGIGEPGLFAEQLRRLGARVSPVVYGDHHAYAPADLQQLVRLANGRWVVTTAKDAVKLGPLWGPSWPPCYVARLGVRIESGEDELDSLLDRVATAARTSNPGAAAASPVRES